MVTKCDMVAGFTEYFDDLTQEGRAQVWGVTFPYEQTLERRGAARRFRPEFDALMARLNARLFARLEEERGARRRATVFAFPQQMAALRDRLDAVRQRRLCLDALRPADSAARRVLHQRHAGRHADRSPAGRHRPPVRRRAGGGGAAGRARQGVLRRTAAQGRGDRRVGTGRRESAAGAAEGGLAARRLRGDRAGRRRSASSPCR